jgi:hypothetical protein
MRFSRQHQLIVELVSGKFDVCKKIVDGNVSAAAFQVLSEVTHNTLTLPFSGPVACLP